jgi:hypothetical protein
MNYSDAEIESFRAARWNYAGALAEWRVAGYPKEGKVCQNYYEASNALGELPSKLWEFFDVLCARDYSVAPARYALSELSSSLCAGPSDSLCLFSVQT